MGQSRSYTQGIEPCYYENEHMNIVLTFETTWSSGGQVLLHCMIIASNNQARLNSAGMCLSY